jgi:hypothetical protein
MAKQNATTKEKNREEKTRLALFGTIRYVVVEWNDDFQMIAVMHVNEGIYC